MDFIQIEYPNLDIHIKIYIMSWWQWLTPASQILATNTICLEKTVCLENRPGEWRTRDCFMMPNKFSSSTCFMTLPMPFRFSSKNWTITFTPFPVQQTRIIWANVSHIDGLVQERRNSCANALDLRFPCTNPSIYPQQLMIWLQQWPSTTKSCTWCMGCVFVQRMMTSSDAVWWWWILHTLQ